MQLEYRWTAGQADLTSKYAAELVGMRPDVILSHTTASLFAMRKETRTIPIVFVMVSDPVRMGHVESMGRPGGNVTGFTPFDPLLGGKWIDLVKQIAPSVKHVVLPFNPDTAQNAISFVEPAEVAGSSLGMSVVSAHVRSTTEIERAIAEFAQQPAGCIIIVPDAFTFARLGLIVAAAARYRLPLIAPFREFTAAGGLLSYGINQLDEFRRAATYIDRVLRGEKPSELPVQAPAKFHLAINLKTAHALGLEMPPDLVARADEVIE